MTDENRRLPRILNSPPISLNRFRRHVINTNEFFPNTLPLVRHQSNNPSSFTFDLNNNDDTSEEEKEEFPLNIDLIQQENIIDKMTHRYPYDENLIKLKELIQDIDKKHKVKIEEIKDKNKYLKTKIKNIGKDLHNLEKYKENYLTTMKNIPLNLVKTKIINNKCSICLEDHQKIGEKLCFNTMFSYISRRLFDSSS